MKRGFLVKIYLAVIILGLGVFWVPASGASPGQNPGDAQVTRRLVSLKTVQKKVKECLAQKRDCREALQLYGIKRVLGVAADYQNHDLLLIGKLEGNSPPLHLEDLVLALRNVWDKYAQRQGNTITYTPPGCSIDPSPEILQRLQRLGGDISTPQQMRRMLQQWRTICSRPQKVRVDGLPFDTRFAKIMVDADYLMKKIVDGSLALDIPGFTSLNDMVMNDMVGNMQQGREVSMPMMLNRFWFSPGENGYREDREGRGMILIEKCQVKLLTEKEFLTSTGKIGSGGADPYADRFAQLFTDKYQEISAKRPIYVELESLFRFVSVAKLLKERDLDQRVGFSLDYLLNDYPIRRVTVPPTLPGISHVQEFRQRQRTREGELTRVLSLPSCGGVGIDIRISAANFAKDATGELSSMRDAILAARPSPEAPFWDVTFRSSLEFASLQP